MRGDHARAAQIRGQIGQHGRDVLVGQAVEAVAVHSLVGITARQRERLCYTRLAAVERGVEARDLGDSGKRLGGHAHAREAARLMERSERDQPLERLQHASIDPRRRGEPGSAVHDAVPDGGNRSGRVLGV